MRKSSSLQLIEAQALRKQQTAFCVLTLMVIAALLLLHTLFASLLGEPSNSVVLLLGASFAIKVFELVWLQGKAHGLPRRTARLETGLSIFGSFLLTAVLAYLTDRDDSPYFVLLAIPILQSAYHFGWMTTVLTIASAIGMNFFWIGHYFHLHPPARPTEFLETGMIAVIYTLMGLFVWFLVDQLRHQQTRLYENLEELELAREQLLVEEKLAAVGRLASGIAHEIRNPVAMISSSLATAANPAMNLAEREEMVQIAAKEAGRLERLTSDFLSYARPAKPQRSSILVSDLQLYVVDAVKAHAAAKGVEVVSSPADGLLVEVDSAQIQGALLNLALNGIEAAEASGELSFNAALSGSLVQINIADTGGPIPEADLPRIFEPFYSTKPSGTGLGLAIARRAAQNHGGDLWVSCNEAGRVVFSMTLPCQVAAEQAREL